VPHPQDIYAQRLRELLQPGTRWLDAGCGRRLLPAFLPAASALTSELIDRAACLVGVDLDQAALASNQDCPNRVRCTLTRLPLTDACVDLVTSNMTFEHVEQPGTALGEIRRVLRPDGRLLIHTPNLLYFDTAAARVIPEAWHPWIVRRLDGRAEEDVYPKYYRFNRRGGVERALVAAGFSHFRVELLPSPGLYGHVPLLAQLEAVWNSVELRVPALRATLLIEARAD
jgi:ubiquinone/menaquinone biosynthesis C-methylase UbiE